MRKSIMIGILAAAAMVSCQKDGSGVGGNGRSAMGVRVSDGRSWSKGAESAPGGVLLYSQPLSLSSGDAVLEVYLSDIRSEKAPENAAPEAASKGAVTTTDNIGSLYGSLKLSAYDESGRIYTSYDTDGRGTAMSNVSVTYSGGSWTLAGGPYWWPEGGSLHLCSYSPSSASEWGGSVPSFRYSDGAMHASFSYSIPAYGSDADAELQPDLLVGIDMDQTGTPEASREGYRTADITLTHALTAVRFTRGDIADCHITDVTLENLHPYGTGDLDGSTGEWTWSASGTPVTYSQSFDKTLTGSDKPARESYEGGSLDASSYGERTFMVIPQALPENARIVIYVEDEIHPIELPVGRMSGANASVLGDWSGYAGKMLTFAVTAPRVGQVRVRVCEGTSGSSRTNMCFQNAGLQNIYIRAALVGNWVGTKDGKESIIAPWSEDDGSFTGLVGYKSESTYWYYDPTEEIYYYKYAVAPGSYTSDLFGEFHSPSVPVSLGKSGYTGIRLELASMAQAVPADAEKKSVTAAGWSSTAIGKLN